VSLLNKQAVRKFLLEYSERSRHHEFTRVSPSVFEDLEVSLRESMRAIVKSQPSKGKTIK
jgi:hypothetical protein